MVDTIGLHSGPQDFPDAVTFADAVTITGALTVSGAVTVDHVAPTFTVGTESTDTIAVVMASGVAAVQRFRAEVFDSATMVALAATFTIAETGAGAEVVGSGTPQLIFTTSAAGAATITITDVVGASSKTAYLVVTPVLTSAASEVIVAPGYAVATFDGA